MARLSAGVHHAPIVDVIDHDQRDRRRNRFYNHREGRSRSDGDLPALFDGIDVTEDSISIEAMKAVCLGGPGHYLGSDQTLQLMQTEYIYPAVGNRMSPKEWEEAQKPDLLEGAIARKDAILDKAPCQVPPETDRAVRDTYRMYF